MSWWNKPKTEQEQTTLTKLMERMGLMDIEMVKMSAQLDNCDQKIKVLRGFMNKFRGEFDLKAGDTTYKLKFTINSMVLLEETLGKSVNQIGVDVGIKELRALIWAGLQHHHPNSTNLSDTQECRSTMLDRPPSQLFLCRHSGSE